MIKGGYYIKSRKIQESKIASAPPHVREIWDWLLREVNYKDANVGGTVIKRGQTVRSFKDIQEGLSWTVGYRKETYKKWHCEIAMKWLTKELMITTTRTTRGLLITICNYDYYQDPKNYENDSETETKLKPKRQGTDTINKKEKNKEEKEDIDMSSVQAETKFDFKKSLLSENAKENFVDDWLKVRKTKKATNSKTALSGFLREVKKSNMDINDVLELCIKRDWKGFDAEWVPGDIKTKKTNEMSEFQKKLQEQNKLIIERGY